MYTRNNNGQLNAKERSARRKILFDKIAVFAGLIPTFGCKPDKRKREDEEGGEDEVGKGCRNPRSFEERDSQSLHT